MTSLKKASQFSIYGYNGRPKMGNLVKTPLSEVTSTLEILDKLNIQPDHLARLRAEPDYAKRVAEFMLRGGLEASIHQKLARAIMGKNFWGVEEWSSLYGVNFTKKQLRQVAEFPWSEDILNAPCPFVKGKSVLRETHFAFLGLDRLNGKSLTILKWHELHPATGQPRFYSANNPWYCSQWHELHPATGQPQFYSANNPWYGTQKFATEITCGLRWYLMPLAIVSGSESKTYEEQVAMLPQSDYEVPTACEEVTKDILYYRKNGICLNPSRWGRTQAVTSNGYRVGIGGFGDGFGESGLGVGRYWDGFRDYYVGLAASRKF